MAKSKPKDSERVQESGVTDTGTPQSEVENPDKDKQATASTGGPETIPDKAQSIGAKVGGGDRGNGGEGTRGNRDRGPSDEPQEKAWWRDKNFAVSVLSLLVALIALWLYVQEVTKAPDLELTAFSPNPQLNKVSFVFSGAEQFSEPLELDLRLVNRGRAKCQGPTFTIMFSPLAKVGLRDAQHWQIQETPSHCRAYLWEDRTLVIGPNTSRPLGAFDLQVMKPADDLLVACFFMDGDFPRKAGLLYYSPSKMKYVIRHFTEPSAGFGIWNAHVRRWGMENE